MWQVKNAAASTAARHGAGVLEVTMSLNTVLQGDEGIMRVWEEALAAAGRCIAQARNHLEPESIASAVYL